MKSLIIFLLFVLGLPILFSADPVPTGTYPDPTKFESAIREFEASDAKSPPPAGAIVAVGSSTLRLWASDIGTDLAPLTIIPRGFGGSNMHDALHYVDRIAINYKPRAILLYEGDNDLAQGISPELIRDTFLKLVTKVHDKLPETRIYILSIKPSIARRTLWPEAQRTNRLFAEECEKDKLLIYLDVATPMLDANGEVRADLFIEDKLHMNRAGYDLWRKTLKPLLDKHELASERITLFRREFDFGHMTLKLRVPSPEGIFRIHSTPSGQFRQEKQHFAEQLLSPGDRGRVCIRRVNRRFRRFVNGPGNTLREGFERLL